MGTLASSEDPYEMHSSGSALFADNTLTYEGHPIKNETSDSMMVPT